MNHRAASSLYGYTTQDTANLLGLAPGQVRSFVHSGFLAPRRGKRGEWRFSFQDLVLLRAAKGLVAARIPGRRVRGALGRLREQLPSGRPLTAVRILADGNQIVVRDDSTVWNPESGQTLLDFDVADLVREAAPLSRRSAAEARSRELEMGAEDWYQLGCELDLVAPDEAIDAYARALQLEGGHADVHLNLGRLRHERGELAAAEEHYRRALENRPGDATAAFNLGVVLQDRGQADEAAAAYEAALEADPGCADAHYNLAVLLEQKGSLFAALQHLMAYRKLIQR